MNINAEQIQKTCSGLQSVESEIKTLLKTIQSEILENSKNGSTCVVVPIPTNFSIVNMSNQTAQTVIYHRLIEELEKRGFNVKIEMNTSSVKYTIRWDPLGENIDLTEMRTFIAAHMTKK